MGTRVHLSGDSKDLWIEDYNVRVDSEGTVISEPSPRDKKILICIDSIDGDHNVTAAVRRCKITSVIEIAGTAEDEKHVLH